MKPGTGSVLVADLDGNGRADILRLSIDGKNTVFRSDGSKFVKQTDFEAVLVGAGVRFHLGDYNADGHKDLLRLQAGSTVATLLASSGNAYVQRSFDLKGTDLRRRLRR